MPLIQTLLLELGYKKTYSVENLHSIASLYSRSNRCGIYILHFANGEYYVGKTFNIVRRYREHRQKHSDIQQLSFKKVGKRALDQAEKAVVQAFERHQLRLRNISLVEFSYSVTNFDEIMSREEQARWLTDVNYDDLSGTRPDVPELRRKYTKKYEEFLQLPRIEEVLDMLSGYIQMCIPAPCRSEMDFWSLSCFPYPNLYARINVGGQTVFDIFRLDTNELMFKWYLTRGAAEETFDYLIEYDHNGYWYHPNFEFDVLKSDMIKGGLDQCCILTRNIGNAWVLLHEENALRGLRRFNLGLMQKGKCLWARNHCLDLADHLFELIE